MKASVRWLNSLLAPGGLSTEQVEQLLTDAGFPIDGREERPGGDVCLEVEVTSNRGDCLSHTGLAREIAARTAHRLKPPAPPAVKSAGSVAECLRLKNHVPDACPRFTAQVIRGVTVRPSPEWLTQALESVGQRPINNIVDITNYLNFLHGQPMHAFDLDKLAGASLIVRWAQDGESLTTLDGKVRKLKADELVIADDRAAQSLAGVMGGHASEVSGTTRNVVLEAATWDPVAVRRASRRHAVRTDAGHRFERGVDARTIDEPAKLAAALIADLGGGTLCSGMLDEGRRAEPLKTITLRPERCRALIGLDIETHRIEQILGLLSIRVQHSAGGLVCEVPAFRLDLEREVDLIEEVARVHGLDQIPIQDRIKVAVRAPQATEAAARAIGTVLNGLGFFETVTFSFITPAHAQPFLAAGLGPIAVDDDRRKNDGTLRPSTIPSLLICRKANQDGGVHAEDGVRLYETAATFAERSGGAAGIAAEKRTLALLMDVPGVAKGKTGGIEERQRAVRLLRGAVESVVGALGGDRSPLTFRAAAPPVAAYERNGYSEIVLGGRVVGGLGLIDAGTQKQFDLGVPVAAAELELDAVIALYPPKSRVHQLPAFPGIERDISLVVDESVTWESVSTLVRGAALKGLEDLSFIGAYRGKQVGPGKKSVTLRMRFRDPSRTLKHEEVDPQVASIVQLAGQKLSAAVRV